MIEQLRWRFHHKQIVISPDNEELIKQLLKYRWNPKKTGDAMETTRIKKDEDFVDALMLSFFSLIEEYETAVENLLLI